MPDNPYASPAASLNSTEGSKSVKKSTLRWIGIACVAGGIDFLRAFIGLFVPLLTAIHSLWAAAFWSWPEIILFAVLLFGFYKKSRIAAMLLIINASIVALRQLVYVETGAISAVHLLVDTLFIIIFVIGFFATVSFHWQLRALRKTGSMS